MSNILPTVGRNVQYIDRAGNLRAAVITDIIGSVIELAVYDSSKGIIFIKDAKEFNTQAREVQVNVFKLTWQAR